VEQGSGNRILRVVAILDENPLADVMGSLSIGGDHGWPGQTAERGGARGFDVHKRVKGRKRNFPGWCNRITGVLMIRPKLREVKKRFSLFFAGCATK
jgi:hypothetical protein